jgi:hypothetical protein
MEVDAIYLKGDFSVHEMDGRWVLDQPTTLQYGSWKNQGLPFYPYAVNYEYEVMFTFKPEKAMLDIGEYGASVISVTINGQSAGLLHCDGIKAMDIADYLTVGKNQILLRVCGTFKNLMGPHFVKARGTAWPAMWQESPEFMPEATEYDLPVATASTLGGVKVGNNLAINDGVLTAAVDSVLSGSSTNPVQNSVINSNISAINSELGQLDTRTDNLENSVSTLSSTVTSQGTTITGLGNDVSALQTAVETNTNNIGTNTGNTGNISANATAIGDLDDRLDTAEDNITNQGNAINEMAGEINDFTLTSDTDVEYSYLLPVNTWSQGKITYSRRGKNGLISFNLVGNMNLAANTETQIYQIPDTFQNSIECSGTLNTNVGPLTVNIDSNRNISFANITASAMNQITKVRGQLVVVLE